MINFIIIFAASLVAGVLYRLGGIGKPWDTKYRDLGVPVIALGVMLVLGYSISWQLILSTILLFASLTTYWKKINKFFGDTDENCHYYNWFVHGLICGLAYLPMILLDVSIYAFLTRAIGLGLLTMWSSEMISEVTWEEGSRGFLIVFTLGLLVL